MKITHTLTAVPFLMVSLAPAARADISLGAPAAIADPQEHGVYHAELLASNAVNAEFKELRSLPVVSLDKEPSTEEVAVFEVKLNLAHRRYDRMGDPALRPGSLFSVSLGSDIPGQDASLGEQIRELKPGDQALLNMDHIYVFREEGNGNVRACTRFIKIDAPLQQKADTAAAPEDGAAEPAAIPAEPQRSMLNVHSTSRQVFTKTTIEPDGQGGTRRMKVMEVRERDAYGRETVRKFINDIEVDPQTDKPLPLGGAPAAAPAAQPDASAAAEAEPQAQPADTAPAPDTAPTEPAFAPENSF